MEMKGNKNKKDFAELSKNLQANLKRRKKAQSKTKAEKEGAKKEK